MCIRDRYTIGIDPGHQETPDAELEQMAPGVKRTKERQSPGSTGVKTGVPEYKINLLIAFKLRDLLEAEGATVVLTRETSDFSLSNMERADVYKRQARADPRLPQRFRPFLPGC